MSRNRSIYFGLILALVGFGLAGCSGGIGADSAESEIGTAHTSSSSPKSSSEGGSGDPAPSLPADSAAEGEGEFVGEPTESAGVDGDGGEGVDGVGDGVEEQSVLQAGQLTAGEWDDNLNFDHYQQYLSDYLQNTPSMPALPTADRVLIEVVDSDGAPISNANVTIFAGDEVLLNAPTTSNGQLLFFPGHDGATADDQLTIKIDSPFDMESVEADLDCEEQGCVFVLEGAEAQLPASLDLAFVVDATGSMSDELEYLKAEIDYIAMSVKENQPNVTLRFALIVYRDIGDKYVTKVADFTTDLEDFRTTLEKQSANGGGDYPEAMEQALEDMNGLSWDDGNTARLAFLVADAPPHTEDASAFLDEVDVARSQGIKIYPVAASGVALEAEYLMRVAAQTTLARYLFLTDDSGIGLAHEEPHIPCYHVQLLSDLTVRMILSELGGSYVAPDVDKIVRTVGNVQDGVCTLSDDSPAYLWLAE